MEICCCYRLIPDGEVIHSVYDTESRKIIGLPIEFIDSTLLELPEYARGNYRGYQMQFDQMCESILLSNSEHAIVVESNKLGYYVLQWDGWWKFMESGTDDKYKGHDSFIPHSKQFKPIGYRRTVPRQMRSFSSIYKLTASVDGSAVYTQDGILIPEFDINSLCRPSYNYVGYKDMIAKDCYAVVYQDGVPRFVEKRDDRLILI